MSSLLPDRWNRENLASALRRPQLIERELRLWVSAATYPVYNWRRKQQLGEGIDVMAEDWDSLLILDACRFDYLRERNTVDGDLRSVTSAASTSQEFVAANFAGRSLHDTVYVTANPYVEELTEDVFYTVENLLIDEWDEETGTVPPSAVVDAAVDAHERYPNKRLIVHFMQPHTPYIGPTADEIRERVGLDDRFNKYRCVEGRDVELTTRTWFGAVMEGEITLEELHEVYAENVDIALEHAQEVVSAVDGKSVVTADHGELLGERLGVGSHRSFGHGPDCYAPELRVVPWLATEATTRREITENDPIGFERLDQQRVDDRLEALGYVTE